MKSLDSVAYKQVRAGGFGSTEPNLASKRKRTAMAFIFVIAMVAAHKVLTVMGYAS